MEMDKTGMGKMKKRTETSMVALLGLQGS